MHFSYFIETKKGGVEVDTLRNTIKAVPHQEIQEFADAQHPSIPLADAVRVYNETADTIRNMIMGSIQSNLEAHQLEISEN